MPIPTPDFDTFASRRRGGFLAALAMELPGDILTPVAAYRSLRSSSTASFLLESVEGGDRIARYSFLGVDPGMVIESQGGRVTIRREGKATAAPGDLFSTIHSLLPIRPPHPDDDLPAFVGGFVGFIGYDEIRSIERIPSRATDATGAPDSLLGFFPGVVVFDHLKRRTRLVACADPSDESSDRSLYSSLVARLERLRRAIFDAGTGGSGPRFRGSVSQVGLPAFPSMVSSALGHIRDGDVFQVVLSAAATLPFEGDPFQVYRALRMINPSPYHFYFDFGETRLLGASPEMLARLVPGSLEHVPIAGTRRRGRNAREDAELAEGLLADRKERSEHVMLVDLGRNDVSRVCRPGSVRVERFMEIERYSHVMHLVSLVRGEPLPDTGAVDVLRALFPAGTVSGAPKVRAMEIIDSLEDSRRGFYAGAAGYVSLTGTMDFCLTIRSMLAFRGALHLRAGAGIVAESDPSRECGEVRNKLGALFEAVRLAGEVEP